MALKEIIKEIEKLSTADQYRLNKAIIKHQNNDTTVSKMVVDSCLFATDGTYDRLRLSRFTI
jgi:hypothetical protein